MTVRRALPLLLALLLGLASSLLVACGGGSGGGLIPQHRATAMEQQLDRVSAAVHAGRCQAAGQAVDQLQREVNALSGDVDAALRTRLQEGVANLARRAPQECLGTATTTTTETVPTTTETVPTTTETTPTTTETTPTTTETTPTATATTPATPPAPPATTTPEGGAGSGGATVPQGQGTGATGGTGGSGEAGGAGSTP